MIAQHLSIFGTSSLALVQGQEGFQQSRVAISIQLVAHLIIEFSFLQFLYVLGVLVQDVFTGLLLLRHGLLPV